MKHSWFGSTIVLVLVMGMMIIFAMSRGDERRSTYRMPSGCYVVTERSDGLDWNINDIRPCRGDQ